MFDKSKCLLWVLSQIGLSLLQLSYRPNKHRHLADEAVADPAPAGKLPRVYAAHDLHETLD